ncbi:MAG TPA: AAA family ATPase [Thermotogota bacterium]|nr:AAA family ATPase [Thermotogota bacterium]
MTKAKPAAGAGSTGKSAGYIIPQNDTERLFLLQCYTFKDSARALKPFTRELSPFGKDLIREIVEGGTGDRALETLTIDAQNTFLAGLQPTDFVFEYYEEWLKILLAERGYLFSELAREFAKLKKTDGVRAEIKSIADLMAREFDPPAWIVEGFLPEGLTFVVGKPKIGKSWLALSLALSVAQGKPFLGFPTDRKKTLYYALEDSERRLNSRIHKLGGVDDGAQLSYSTTLESLSGGGIERIEENLQAGYKLIIIDTFARVKSATKRDAYAEETQALSGLQALSLAYNAAIILIHHARKNTDSADIYDSVLGSTALSGTADATILITRDRKTRKLILAQTGRDIEDKEIAIEFSADNGDFGFNYLGNADEVLVSEVEGKIIDHLKNTEFHLTPAELSQALCLKANTVKGTCYRLFEELKIDKEDGKLKYFFDRKRRNK